jgi:hypothetical protein
MGSFVPGSTGKDPRIPSATTGGPTGTNKDAADPDTPVWFVGDTCGPLGCNDHADPDSQMCRLRNPFEQWYLMFKRGREDLRKKIKSEIEEAHRIRDAFADKALLEEALRNNWSTAQYQEKVAEKVFGTVTTSSPQSQVSNQSVPTPPSVSPMGTDPFTCKINENWHVHDYFIRGLPEEVYQADRAHEEEHRKNCLASNQRYAANMSFPAKLSAEEIKAYTVKIEFLEKKLREL